MHDNIICTPYWWDIAGEPSCPQPSPIPIETEVLIIGAGLTGLACAYELARAGKEVHVIDSLMPGQGASARNGGMIGGGQKLSVKELDDLYGYGAATKILREAHIDSIAYCQNVMAEEDIDCDFDKCGRFVAFWRPKEIHENKKKAEILQQRIGLNIRFVDKADVASEVNSSLYCGGYILDQHGGLNPKKWVDGLQKAVLNAGGGITPLCTLKATEKQGSDAFLAQTNLGDIKCKKIVMATNGYTLPQFSFLKRRIIPVPSFIITTEELGQDAIKELFPNHRMIVETRHRYSYYRPSPDLKRVVFGGRAAMFKAPAAFTTGQLRKMLRQVFPRLKACRITHSWHGYTGFSFDFKPHLGEYDGINYAVGYSGNGNSLAPYLGYKVAMKILNRQDESETAFAEIPHPKRWWYRKRAWFMPALDVNLRTRDMIDNWRRGQ